MVTSVAASYHPDYTGVALDVTVIDACTATSDDDTVAGLDWVTNTSADPINASIAFNDSPATNRSAFFETAA